MKRAQANRRRPAVHITLTRAARLHRLLMLLAEAPRTRDVILGTLAMGLRTFYRELELLHRCGVKIQHREKTYHLHGTAADAEGKLPFPDPQLSFAEMAELARHPGAAARRLAELLQTVINLPAPAKRRAGRGGRGGPKKGTE
jgi:hypothetical protein